MNCLNKQTTPLGQGVTPYAFRRSIYIKIKYCQTFIGIGRKATLRLTLCRVKPYIKQTFSASTIPNKVLVRKEPAAKKAAMMKSWHLILGILVMLAAVPPATADFYRYKDKHGNTMYTDDLSKVPVDQRQQVQSYEDSRSAPAASAVQEAQKAPAQEQDDTTDKKAYDQLKQREQTLRNEYNNLKAEYDRLKKAEQEAVTPAQRKAHNKQVEEFNTRFQTYEKKRNALETDLNALNKKIDEKQAAEKKQ